MTKRVCIGKRAQMEPTGCRVESRAYHWRVLEVISMAYLKHFVQISRVEAQTCKGRQNWAKWRKLKFLPGGQLRDVISPDSELRLEHTRYHWKYPSTYSNFYEETLPKKWTEIEENWDQSQQKVTGGKAAGARRGHRSVGLAGPPKLSLPPLGGSSAGSVLKVPNARFWGFCS